MYRIAICDDEKYIGTQIENFILSHIKDILEKIDIEVFYLAEELYDFIENYHGFDLIF